jgi:hypothetical protein
MSGCFLHKQAQNQQPPLAPPVDDGPVTKPDSAPKDLPPSVVTDPAKPTPPATDTSANTQDQPKPTPRHRKPAQKPAAPANAPTTPAPPTEQASTGTPEVSAIGKLSTGDSEDLRSETARSLFDTEHGLNGINRKLSTQELKTSAQIREYLKQAHAALESNDLEGAKTLAIKAKLLLGELTQ